MNTSSHNNITTSYGIITYTLDEGVIKYLLICRKDSLGFIDFVRGKYPSDIEYVRRLIDEMTIDEKKLLLTQDFKKIWDYLWSNYTKNKDKHDYIMAEAKFTKITLGINIYDSYTNFKLDILIQESLSRWVTPEWGFPKGRKNYNEPDIRCALREFEEETGLPDTSVQIIYNMIPFDETFIGSNYKLYKHTYFIAKYTGSLVHKDFQKTEVSDMTWATYDECLKLIRCYNKERLDILEKVNTILHKFKLIY
jgi:ADP-ribose pyrophosphatase YjhB (NUDIX family)